LKSGTHFSDFCLSNVPSWQKVKNEDFGFLLSYFIQKANKEYELNKKCKCLEGLKININVMKKALKA
jgi:hypothetical protein